MDSIVVINNLTVLLQNHFMKIWSEATGGQKTNSQTLDSVELIKDFSKNVKAQEKEVEIVL